MKGQWVLWEPEGEGAAGIHAAHALVSPPDGWEVCPTPARLDFGEDGVTLWKQLANSDPRRLLFDAGAPYDWVQLEDTGKFIGPVVGVVSGQQRCCARFRPRRDPGDHDRRRRCKTSTCTQLLALEGREGHGARGRWVLIQRFRGRGGK